MTLENANSYASLNLTLGEKGGVMIMKMIMLLGRTLYHTLQIVKRA